MTEPPDEQKVGSTHQVLDWARAGDTDSLVAAVDSGVPVDLASASGDTLLMLAAYHEHPHTVRALLARGADHSRTNERGQTPLVAAVVRRSVASVTALLAAGADPDAGSPSARETATFFDLPEMAALLAGVGPAPPG